MSAAVIARLEEREVLWYVDVAAQRHGVSREDVCGPGRTKPVAAARHDAWRALYAFTHLSMPQIGNMWRVHHTTVLAAVNPDRKAKASARSKAAWTERKGRTT